MALHDPESSQKEKNLALKLGRQKKIQIIDGQQVEVLGGFDDEDEEGLEDDGEMGHPGMAEQVKMEKLSHHNSSVYGDCKTD